MCVKPRAILVWRIWFYLEVSSSFTNKNPAAQLQRSFRFWQIENRYRLRPISLASKSILSLSLSLSLSFEQRQCNLFYLDRLPPFYYITILLLKKFLSCPHSQKRKSVGMPRFELGLTCNSDLLPSVRSQARLTVSLANCSWNIVPALESRKHEAVHIFFSIQASHPK